MNFFYLWAETHWHQTKKRREKKKKKRKKENSQLTRSQIVGTKYGDMDKFLVKIGRAFR